MEKDIKIEVTDTKSVQSVNYEELYNSLRDTMRTIQLLSMEYEDDNDFGRNVRKLINFPHI